MRFDVKDFCKKIKILKKDTYATINIGGLVSCVMFDTRVDKISVNDLGNGNYEMNIVSGVGNISLYEISFQLTPKTIIVSKEDDFVFINTRNDELKTYIEISFYKG